MPGNGVTGTRQSVGRPDPLTRIRRLRDGVRAAFAPRLVQPGFGKGTLALLLVGPTFLMPGVPWGNRAPPMSAPASASIGVMQSFGVSNATARATLSVSPGTATTASDLLVALIRDRNLAGVCGGEQRHGLGSQSLGSGCQRHSRHPGRRGDLVRRKCDGPWRVAGDHCDHGRDVGLQLGHSVHGYRGGRRRRETARRRRGRLRIVARVTACCSPPVQRRTCIQPDSTSLTNPATASALRVPTPTLMVSPKNLSESVCLNLTMGQRPVPMDTIRHGRLTVLACSNAQNEGGR